MAHNSKSTTCLLRWLEAKQGTGASYDIVHLGLARASTRTHDIAKSLRNDFPDARNAYVLPGEDVSCLFKEGIWKRQADDLLEELQEGEEMNDQGDNRKNPVIFVCWGTVGGIILKQAILQLNEHADTKYDFYDRVSGVFFLGCLHDECSDRFGARVFWTILKEFDHVWRMSDFESTWKPLVEWIGTITANFRKLKLLFPVWTYYEGVGTVYKREDRVVRQIMNYVEILCSSEVAVLDASPSRTRVLPLNHDRLCSITNSKDVYRDYFLNDLRTIAGTTKEKENDKDRISVDTNDVRAGTISKGSSISALYPPQPLTPAIRDYRVGWICALPFEAAAAVTMLDKQYPDLPRDSRSSVSYILGRIGLHNVVIACLPSGRAGTSAASVVATEMLQRFRSITFGFMVGIGGGIPSNKDDIRLGDVVVSRPSATHGGVVQYDIGKAEKGGRFRRTGHLNNPPSFLLSVLNLVQINHERGRRTYPDHMERYTEEKMEEYTFPQSERDILFRSTYPHSAGAFDCTTCNPKQVIKRPDRNTRTTTIRIHYGIIASGNQVIKDAQRRDKIVKDLGGQVLCFEMEAAGLMNDFPCLVVRGISDYCDSHKNDGWQKYAAATAAAYTRELLLLIPPEDVVM